MRLFICALLVGCGADGGSMRRARGRPTSAFRCARDVIAFILAASRLSPRVRVAAFHGLAFILEPLVLHQWLSARAERKPVATFKSLEWLHRILLLVSLATILGAVMGSHACCSWTDLTG